MNMLNRISQLVITQITFIDISLLNTNSRNSGFRSGVSLVFPRASIFSDRIFLLSFRSLKYRRKMNITLRGNIDFKKVKIVPIFLLNSIRKIIFFPGTKQSERSSQSCARIV